MAENKEKSVFEILNSVDVNDKKETRNGLTYLSWAWAWTETKKRFPDANYKVYENDMGFPYHTDGRTCWVKCGVTIQGIEQIEYLSVMDYRNQSIPLAKVTSVDVIKTIQRCVTKAIGRHGLGLYIYAKEDLPEDAENATEAPQESKKPASKAKTAPAKQAPSKAAQAPQEPEEEAKLPFDIPPEMVKQSVFLCSICKQDIEDYDQFSRDVIIRDTTAKFGAPICFPCLLKRKAKKAEG